MVNRIKPGFRLLVVDDSPEDILFVERALKLSGVGDFFHAVSDGHEAVAYLRAEGKYSDRSAFPFPNALLLDLKMPGMNGFEVLRWLQEHPECKVIPTIAFSSSFLERDVHDVYVLGGNAFVTKPTDLQEFTELIQDAYKFWSRCETPQPPLGERCA